MLAWLPLVAVSLASLSCIWWPMFPTGTDMPTHLMTAAFLVHPEHLAPWLQWHFAATSQLSVWLTVPFAAVMSLPMAGLCGLTLFAGMQAGAGAWLARTYGVDGRWGALVALSHFFGFGFAMGFTNFLVGNACGLGLLAVVRMWSLRRDWRTWAGVMMIAVVCAHAHIIAFGMFALQGALMLAVDVLGGRRPPGAPPVAERGARGPAEAGLLRLFRVWVAYVGAALPALGLTGVVLQGIRAPLASHFDESMVGGVRLPLTDLAWGVVDMGVGGWTVAAWALLPLWLLVVWSARGSAGAAERFGRLVLVVTTALLWLGLYVAVPFHLGGWAFASPRVLPLVWTVPLLVVGLPGVGVRWVYAVVAAAVLVWTGWVQVPAATALTEAYAELQVDEPPGRTVVVREPVPRWARSQWVEPMHHAASYAVARGGAMQHMIRWNRWMHSVTLRPDVLTGTPWMAMPPEFIGRSLEGGAPEAAWVRLADRTAMQSLAFDSVVVVRRPVGMGEAPLPGGLVAGLADRGFMQLSPAVLRPVGHVVRVQETVDAQGPLLLELAWPTTLGPLGRRPTTAAELSAGVEAGPLPAGPALMVVRSADGTVLAERWVIVGP